MVIRSYTFSNKMLAINILFFFQLIAILIVFVMGTSFRNLKNASHALRPSESWGRFNQIKPSFHKQKYGNHIVKTQIYLLIIRWSRISFYFYFRENSFRRMILIKNNIPNILNMLPNYHHSYHNLSLSNNRLNRIQ